MSKPRLFSDKTLFLTDLDSTLIRSHRHPAPADCVWVEMLNGHRQSFMTKETHQYFSSQTQYRVVPLTTRTHAQYDRLAESFSALGWDTALICNGAVLLENGTENKAWSEASAALAAPDLPALLALKQTAETAAGAENIIWTEPFFFYVRGADPEQMYALLREKADPERFAVFRDSRKVYCIPHALSKGSAARRFLQYTGQETLIAAGDSAFDLPLLAEADIGICPEALREYASAKGQLFPCSGCFSDAICKILEQCRKA